MAETIESMKSKIEELQKEVAKLKSSVKKKKFGLVWTVSYTHLTLPTN